MPFYTTRALDKGIVIKAIDSYLSKEPKEIRKNSGWNSPSLSSGCLRRAFLSRVISKHIVHPPRTRRIFENGDDVHERLQRYLTKEGLLLIDEATVFSKEYQIHGRTDGIIKVGNGIGILEIKSMNNGQFSNLTYADENHAEQALLYAYCVNDILQKLNEDAPSLAKDYLEFLNTYLDKEKAETRYIKFKEYLSVLEKYKHLKVNKVIIIYENKDNQLLKEYILDYDLSSVTSTLERFKLLNKHLEDNAPPEKLEEENCKYCNYKKECKNYGRDIT